MLHTKFRENRPADSGEGDFLRVFTLDATPYIKRWFGAVCGGLGLFAVVWGGLRYFDCAEQM